MNVLNQASLGDHVSKKMSAWMLVLVATATVAVFAVSFVQSRQMFLKQVTGWTTIVPDQALTSLIDSDHFSIERDVKFLESTGLFSSVCIKDSQQRVIASFGLNPCSDRDFVPIRDDAGEAWGFYSFQPDFFAFILPFLISGGVFLGFIFLLYFIIRWRVRYNLDMEFTRFNEFLMNIELLTDKIHHICNEESEFSLDLFTSQNSEQVIINRAIATLLGEIKKANQSIKKAISATEKKRFQDELTETALQVAHDIGSPLAVLEIIVQSTSISLEEDSRLAIRGATAKIRDIAHSLLKKGKSDILSASNTQLARQHILISLVNQVVSDKRLEFQHRENIKITFDYEDSSYGLFSIIKAADFNRILSNLINNAIESLDDSGGHIVVKLTKHDNCVLIKIEDNGKGIPPQILEKLGERGVTYGKEQGNGLGIHHAKSTIESWGGELSIISEPGCGSSVLIKLANTQTPAWFVPALEINDQQAIIIIDDDESIHQLWKNRFNQFQAENFCQVNLTHLYTPFDLNEWVQVNGGNANHVLYLCDYEFSGSQHNGVKSINNLNIIHSSILVTSRYFEDEIISECEASNIRLLPKDMACIIPIVREY